MTDAPRDLELEHLRAICGMIELPSATAPHPPRLYLQDLLCIKKDSMVGAVGIEPTTSPV